MLISFRILTDTDQYWEPEYLSRYNDWLDDLVFGLRVLVESRISFLRVTKTGSGPHRFSYPVGTGTHSLGVNLPRRESNHSPPTSAEVKKTLIYTSALLYVFIAYCLIC
jgi:hypothetical protein